MHVWLSANNLPRIQPLHFEECVDAADGLKTLNMQHGTLLPFTLGRRETLRAKSVCMLSQALEPNGAFFTSLQNLISFRTSLPNSTNRYYSIPAAAAVLCFHGSCSWRHA